MKRIAVLFLVLTFLTSCTSKTDTKVRTDDDRKNERISFYVDYIDSLKYEEHTKDYIYSMDNMSEKGVFIDKFIVGVNRPYQYMTINEVQSLKDIDDMKVSNNDQYMAITFNDVNGRRATKLQIIKLETLISQDKLRDISDYKLYQYELSEFNKEEGIDIDLMNESIYLKGFSKEGKVLWGMIGGKIDISYEFIIKMDTGEVIFLKDSESYARATEKYAVFQ